MLLGIPNKKLLRKAIQPAEVEVNGMDNFGVKIEPIRKGARSSVSAFPGGKGYCRPPGSVQGTETSQSGTDGEAARHGGADCGFAARADADHAELAERLAEMRVKESATRE